MGVTVRSSKNIDLKNELPVVGANVFVVLSALARQLQHKPYK